MWGPLVRLVVSGCLVLWARSWNAVWHLVGIMGRLCGVWLAVVLCKVPPIGWLLSERQVSMVTWLLGVRVLSVVGSSFLRVLSLWPILTCSVRKSCPVGRLFAVWDVVGTVLSTIEISCVSAANGLLVWVVMTCCVTWLVNCLLLQACSMWVSVGVLQAPIMLVVSGLIDGATCTLRGVLIEQVNFCLAWLTRSESSFRLVSRVCMGGCLVLLSMLGSLLQMVRNSCIWLLKVVSWLVVSVRVLGLWLTLMRRVLG